MSLRVNLPLLPISLIVIQAMFGSSNRTSGVALPDPTGSFVVGRVGYDWTDPARAEALSDDPHSHRELMVYVWYPSAPTNAHSVHAPYLPGTPVIDKSPLGQDFTKTHNDIWPLIVSGKIQTHAFENNPIAGTAECFPLPIFSHGGGVPAIGYTSQIEDLVSHGYIVASIEHTYGDGVVAFPDGRVIPLSPTVGLYTKLGSPETHEWERGRDDVWAADIRFVLDELSILPTGQRHGSRFFGRLDLNHIGVVGHSIGGRAVARACQLDLRIKACANEDGYLTSDGPILIYKDTTVPTQPFLFLQAFPQPLSDTVLASAHLTRQQLDQMLADARSSVKTELERCPGGSYWVIVNLPGFEHYSFTDLRLIKDVGDPQNESNDLRGLQVIRSYIEAFFDKYLKEEKAPLLDTDSDRNPSVEIQRFRITSLPGH